MFTDTHCHLSGVEKRGIILEELFAELAQKNYPFVLDAGTSCDDLPERLKLTEIAKGACGQSDFLFFSGGIWPHAEIIPARFAAVEELEKNIVSAQKKGGNVVALGECGLDRHWNRDNPELLAGEAELFALQIEAAKKLDLPLIIHSREAFDETHSILANGNYHTGVIHCYSYGKKEATAFLDAGWYISLSGAITYLKGNEGAELVRHIPKDRLLLETDAPYLAPVPFRGKINTPLLIAHTYEWCAKQLGMNIEDLCSLVLANARRLFLFSRQK